MVTVQEAPIVRPPETTGTSAKEELPKSSSADSVDSSNGHSEDAENPNRSNQVCLCRLAGSMLTDAVFFKSNRRPLYRV